MTKLFILSLLPMLVVATSCIKGGGNFLKQKDGAGGSIPLTMQTLGEEKVGAHISASSTETQTMKVANGSDINGMEVSFPPGSLAVSSSVTMQPGAEIALSSVTMDLGLADDTTVSSASAPLVIKSQVSQDTQSPFTLRIPVAAALALADTGAVRELVAFYKVERVLTNETVLGIILAKDIKQENGFAVFSTRYFGAYQLAYVNKVIDAPVEKPVAEKIMTREEQQAMAPLKIASWDVQMLPDPARRMASINISLSEDIPTFCVALVSADGSLPADRSIILSSLKGGLIGGITSKEHTVLVAVECKDKLGRSVRTGFDKKINFPAMNIDAVFRFAEAMDKTSDRVVLGVKAIGTGIKEFSYAIVDKPENCATANFQEWIAQDKEATVTITKTSGQHFAFCMLGRDNYRNQVPTAILDDEIGKRLGIKDSGGGGTDTPTNGYSINFDRLEDCHTFNSCPFVTAGKFGDLFAGFSGDPTGVTFELSRDDGAGNCANGLILPFVADGTQHYSVSGLPALSATWTPGTYYLCGRLLKDGKEFLARKSPNPFEVKPNLCTSAMKTAASPLESPTNTFTVCNQTQLLAFGTDSTLLAKLAKITTPLAINLGDDIPIMNVSLSSPLLGSTGITVAGGSFTLNGNGFSISNLGISGSGRGIINTLTCSSGSAVIKNLSLRNLHVSHNSATNVGGLIGTASCSNLTIDTVSIDGVINGMMGSVGGLVGREISSSFVTYKDVEFRGAVLSTQARLGGIVGDMSGSNSTITNAAVSGLIKTSFATSGTSAYIGGFVGFRSATSLSYTMISKSLSNANIQVSSAPMDKGLIVGGGILNATNYNTYVASNVYAINGLNLNVAPNSECTSGVTNNSCLLMNFEDSQTIDLGAKWVRRSKYTLPTLGLFLDNNNVLELDSYYADGFKIGPSDAANVKVEGFCNSTLLTAPAQFEVSIRTGIPNNNNTVVRNLLSCPASGHWSTNFNLSSMAGGVYRIHLYNPGWNVWREANVTYDSTPCVESGDGLSPATPLVLCSTSSFLAMTPGRYYKLGKNLDFGSSPYDTVKNSTWSSTGFSSVLNGDGFTLSNVAELSGNTDPYPGLLGKMTGGRVYNLTLKDASIYGKDTLMTSVGAVAAEVDALASPVLSEILRNVRVYGNVVSRADYPSSAVGGIVGTFRNDATTTIVPNLNGLSFSGSVSGLGHTGGLIGNVTATTDPAGAVISKATVRGSVTQGNASYGPYGLGGFYGNSDKSLYLENHTSGQLEIAYFGGATDGYSLILGSTQVAVPSAISIKDSIVQGFYRYPTNGGFDLVSHVTNSSNAQPQIAHTLLHQSHAYPANVLTPVINNAGFDLDPNGQFPPQAAFSVWDALIWNYDMCPATGSCYPQLRNL